MECLLKRVGVLIGMIKPEPGWFDFPWYAGKFVPTDAFEAVRAFFDEELRLSDQEDWEAVDKIRAELVEPGLELAYPDGRTVSELLIHIAGDRADWREC